MEVIVPGRVEPPAALGRAPQGDGLLKTHSRRRSAPGDGRPPRGHAGDGGNNVVLRLVVDGLEGVQPQAVEMEFVDPIAGVGNEELADRPAAGPSKFKACPQAVSCCRDA